MGAPALKTQSLEFKPQSHLQKKHTRIQHETITVNELENRIKLPIWSRFPHVILQGSHYYHCCRDKETKAYVTVESQLIKFM
jgi:hypothetical protein